VVKSNICPVCLADIPGEYVEEGDLRISDEAITCPNCGFVLEGVMDECPELEDLPTSPPPAIVPEGRRAGPLSRYPFRRGIGKQRKSPD